VKDDASVSLRLDITHRSNDDMLFSAGRPNPAVGAASSMA
jgi:hypothetical protein